MIVVVCATETSATICWSPNAVLLPCTFRRMRMGGWMQRTREHGPGSTATVSSNCSNPFAAPIDSVYTPHLATQWGVEGLGVNAVPLVSVLQTDSSRMFVFNIALIISGKMLTKNVHGQILAEHSLMFPSLGEAQSTRRLPSNWQTVESEISAQSVHAWSYIYKYVDRSLSAFNPSVVYRLTQLFKVYSYKWLRYNFLHPFQDLFDLDIAQSPPEEKFLEVFRPDSLQRRHGEQQFAESRGTLGMHDILVLRENDLGLIPEELHFALLPQRAFCVWKKKRTRQNMDIANFLNLKYKCWLSLLSYTWTGPRCIKLTINGKLDFKGELRNRFNIISEERVKFSE